MTNYNLIIFQHNHLYLIFNELEKELKFKIISVIDKNDLKLHIKNNLNYLVLSNNTIPNIKNQIVLNQTPINFFKVLELINTNFLKIKFNNQSKIQAGQYTIDSNSKEIEYQNLRLKLTEKEIKIILCLLKANKPLTINTLQKNVWNYNEDLETHTVETHIYRLRKKILKVFNDNNFIKNKSGGYIF